jgi:hypothetical protein
MKQETNIVPTGIYQHYKGNYYQVMGTAKHSETLEQLVVYRELYGDGNIWVRPAIMFCESVIFNDTLVPRFNYQEQVRSTTHNMTQP